MSAENMQAQVIAGMIVDAIVQDEKPEAGGFDLSAGMFGPALSEAIRKLAREQIDLQRQLAEERAKHDETLTAGEKLLAATNELQRQLAEREREIADLIHPHDLAKYRSAK